MHLKNTFFSNPSFSALENYFSLLATPEKSKQAIQNPCLSQYLRLSSSK